MSGHETQKDDPTDQRFAIPAAGESSDAAARDGAPAGNEPWYPPVALWQLFLLIGLTFGFYPIFWTGRTAWDMRHHVNSKIKPWRYVLGILLPVINMAVVYRQAAQIRRLIASTGQRVGPAPWVVVSLFALTYGLSCASGFVDGLERQGLSVGLTWLALVTVPIPWLLMQRQFNAYKLSLADPQWLGRPFRFTKLQYAALAVGLLFMLFPAYQVYDMLKHQRGVPLAAGIPLDGPRGLYVLVPPGDGWVEVAPGTIEEDTAQEFYGPSTETSAVVYTFRRGDWDLDSLVEFRRDEIEEEVGDFVFSEERTILPGHMLPVSYARYSETGLPFSLNSTWWVATLVTDKVSIEVVATTTDDQASINAIERLVRSLQLRPQGSAS